MKKVTFFEQAAARLAKPSGDFFNKIKVYAERLAALSVGLGAIPAVVQQAYPDADIDLSAFLIAAAWVATLAGVARLIAALTVSDAVKDPKIDKE